MSYTLLVAFFPILYDNDAVIVEEGACAMKFPLSYALYQVLANFLLPVICIIVLNVMLFTVASKHAKVIRQSIIESAEAELWCKKK